MGVRDAIAWAWLALFGAYQLAGFYESRHEARGPLTSAVGDVFWPINWRMFTGYSRSHTAVVFQGVEDGRWVDLPMEAWYPARWESGYRWERPWVYRSGELVTAFLDAACARSGSPATRLVKKTWRKTLGQMEQPERDVKLELLGTRRCDSPRRLPGGVVY